MNLYLLLALAFGAFTGVAEVRVPRAAVTVSIRAERPQSFAVRRSPFAVVSANGERQTANGEPFIAAQSPLAGAATPRAPAVNC